MHELITHVLPLYDAVSFDVFDTFLLRPFLAPADLFDAIGGAEFRQARTQAEHEAAAHTHRPYSIYDIYEHIPTQWKHMQAVELAEEKRRTVINPCMLDVYRKALELGKKIVFASDMYMPEDVLRDILASKGVWRADGVYTSFSRGCSKYDGRLLRAVAEDIGVEPQKMVHIGDSRGADMHGGALAGMYTQYVPKIAETFFEENKMLRTFFNECGGMANTHIRLMFGALALAWHLNKCQNGDDPWCRTGCTHTAPIYYSYMRWAMDQAKAAGKTKLLLALRDCHVLGKMLDSVAPDIDYEYIIATRAIVRPVIDKGVEDAEVAPYAEYVRSAVTDPDKALLVEGPSLYRTAERGLALILGRPLAVRYMNLSGDDNVRFGDRAYMNDKGFLWTYGLLEHLGGSPENPYAGIVDGKPVHRACNNYDRYRNEGIRRRERAAVATATLLHDNGEFLTGEECKKFFKCCFEHTDARDATFFINQIVPGPGVNHDDRGCLYWR